MWAGGLASLGEVSELMNMESVEAWSKSGNFSGNLSLATVFLNELDESLDTRVSIWVHNANSVVSLMFHIFLV